MWSWLTLIFTLLTLVMPTVSFSDEVKAGEGKNIAEAKFPKGYVAPGGFYWTRLYWKGTQDVFMKGKLVTVHEDGTKDLHEVWLVTGLVPTWNKAKVINETAWDLLKIYKTENVFKDYGKNLGGSLLEFPVKSYTHVAHKARVVRDEAVQNFNDIDGSTLVQNWGPLGSFVAYIWNGGKTVVKAVETFIIELPIEYAGRTVWRTLKVVHHAIYPIEPALGAAGCWFVLEPVNGVLDGVPSILAGTTGTLLTATTAGVEGVKYVVWDTWHPAQNEAITLIRVPVSDDVASKIDSLFVNAPESSDSNGELMKGFEEVIASVDRKDQWMVMSYIVSRLTETTAALEKSLEGRSEAEQTQILSEYDQLSTLKIVYSMDLESKLFARQ